MFRRTKTDRSPALGSTALDPETVKVGGKGRPTPTRKEAEAAAKARARVPRTRREQMAAQKATRGETSAEVRAGMRAGEERFLPARDRGPVKRFIRDFVDSRFSFVELMIPVLVVSMVLGYSGQAALARIGNTILLTSVLLMVVDILLMRWRIRRQLAARFPDEPTKGTTYYAITRALQLRFMRIPKTQVKIGQELPERYR